MEQHFQYEKRLALQFEAFSTPEDLTRVQVSFEFSEANSLVFVAGRHAVLSGSRLQRTDTAPQ
jgi:hypothetical protein